MKGFFRRMLPALILGAVGAAVLAAYTLLRRSPALAVDAALDAVIDGEAPNDPGALRAFLAEWLAEHADKARS